MSTGFGEEKMMVLFKGSRAESNVAGWADHESLLGSGPLPVIDSDAEAESEADLDDDPELV